MSGSVPNTPASLAAISGVTGARPFTIAETCLRLTPSASAAWVTVTQAAPCTSRRGSRRDGPGYASPELSQPQAKALAIGRGASAFTEPYRALIPAFRSRPLPSRRPSPRRRGNENTAATMHASRSTDASSACISQSTAKNCPLASIGSERRSGVTMGEPVREPEIFASKLSDLRAISAPLPGTNNYLLFKNLILFD